MTREPTHYAMTPKARPRNAATLLKLKYNPELDSEQRVQPKRTTKQCLRCDKDFKSEGPQHRMCERCRHETAEFAEPATVRPKREFVEAT